MLNGGVSQFVPKCFVLSPFVLFCPDLSPFRPQEGQKRTNGDKTGHFGTNWETPPFSIYPHLAPLKIRSQNMPLNEGSYAVKIPWNPGTFTENMVSELTFMAYELRLLGMGVLSDLPNINTKSQRFSNAISQIALLPAVVALNRSFESQIAARYAAFRHAVPQIALASFLLCL